MKFQNPSIHHSKVNTQTDRQTDTQTDKPKAICPSNFFKVGGIKSRTYESYDCCDICLQKVNAKHHQYMMGKKKSSSFTCVYVMSSRCVYFTYKFQKLSLLKFNLPVGKSQFHLSSLSSKF